MLRYQTLDTCTKTFRQGITDRTTLQSPDIFIFSSGLLTSVTPTNRLAMAMNSPFQLENHLGIKHITPDFLKHKSGGICLMPR
jgi:hypothetical protein